MDQQLGKRIRVLQIVSIFLMVSTLILIFIARWKVEQNIATMASAKPSLEHPMLPILGGYAFFMFIAGLAALPFFVKAARKKLKSGESLKIDHLFAPHIVRFALLETAPIIGFIVVSQSTDMTFMYIAEGAYLAAMIVFFPTEDRIRQLLKG